jgi:hypothetical protein
MHQSDLVGDFGGRVQGDTAGPVRLPDTLFPRLNESLDQPELCAKLDHVNTSPSDGHTDSTTMD